MLIYRNGKYGEEGAAFFLFWKLARPEARSGTFIPKTRKKPAAWRSLFL